MSILTSLDLLEQQVQRDLTYLCLPESPWLPIRYHQGQRIRDVVIVGAGMAGLTLAAALRFAGINNIQLIDKAPAKHEGPWNTHARMQTLRSPKELTGPALGIASLTFRAWYSAQFGEQQWQALDRIPTLMWHDYLQWYKQVLGISVQNQTELNHLQKEQVEHLKHPIAKLEVYSHKENSPQTIYARHVVLATGMDGLGSPYLPSIAQQLNDKNKWAHSSEPIAFERLRNKRVAIVGGGDSALDAAATALEKGASDVDIYLRAADFSQINYWKAFTHSGHRYAYAQLSLEQKATLLNFLLAQRTPPARGTVQRLSQHSNLQLHFDQTIEEVKEEGEQLHLRTQHNMRHKADFIVFATGYATDLRQRKELSELLPHLFLVEHTALGQKLKLRGIPVLNEDFSFKAKSNDYPLLSAIHCFTSQALFSVGKICGDIPSISVGANRLCQGIAAKLYQAEFDYQLQSIQDYSELEVSDEALTKLIQVTGQHIRNSAVV